MKVNSMRKFLITLAAILTSMGTFADGKFETVNDLKFLANTETREAMLCAENYTGNITVSVKFIDDGVTSKVTLLKRNCFSSYDSLTSASFLAPVKILRKKITVVLD